MHMPGLPLLVSKVPKGCVRGGAKGSSWNPGTLQQCVGALGGSLYGAALGQPASFHHLHTYTLCVLGCVSFPLPQNSYVEVLTPVPSECDCI